MNKIIKALKAASERSHNCDLGELCIGCMAEYAIEEAAPLLAHMKELEKDKARLDWVAIDDPSPGMVIASNGKTFRGKTLREAIDAAMAKDQEQDAGGER